MFFYTEHRNCYGPEVMSHPTPCGIQNGRVVFAIAQHEVPEETEKAYQFYDGKSIELACRKNNFYDEPQGPPPFIGD